ncbi:hypothetical protein [Actinomyces sp. oral taxon 448]|uniref:hypothetical protein n=1 Tax=Actinomyces sp. oral taxon 448 TaxID=712124 RepID=UPI000A06CEF1|nr:hypothetical protein [Actinomyces sp. oral taxon 448]
MTYVATVVQVLLSSPSDLPPEHRHLIHSTIRSWNTNYSRRFGVIFSPTDWQEGTSPSYGQEPQAFINEQLVASSDMGLVVFTNRLGTPTKTHLSGTVEEISLLHSQGKRVAILRNTTPSAPASTTDAIQQLTALNDYLNSIKDEALYSIYSSSEQLMQIINNTLNNVARDYEPPNVPSASSAHSSEADPSSGVWPSVEIERYTETDSKGRLKNKRRLYLTLTNRTRQPVTDVSYRYEDSDDESSGLFDLNFNPNNVINTMAPDAIQRYPIMQVLGSPNEADCIVAWTDVNEVSHETKASVRIS